MDILEFKNKYNLTSDELDDLIFLESLEDETKYIKCEKCGKRVCELLAIQHKNCCLSCFDFWYC